MTEHEELNLKSLLHVAMETNLVVIIMIIIIIVIHMLL